MAANVSGSMSGRPIRRGASTSRRRHSRCTIKIHNTNPEWGDGFEGFTKRLGSRQAQFIIQNSVTSFGDGILGWEPRYDRCRCEGFWPRTRHAIDPAGLERQAVPSAAALTLAPTLSERRREENRRNSGTKLRCECAIPTCQETLPIAAGYHRGAADRYIVTPTHVNGGSPVRVADHFFVISNKEGRRSS